jgi:hypothetical protein
VEGLHGAQHGELLGHDQASGGAAESCILWAWNGVDTSQFAAAPLLPTDDFGPSTITGVPALTVVSRPEGNRLLLAVAGLAQQGPLFWPVAAVEGLSLPMRYVMRYTMFASINVSGLFHTGVFFYSNGEVALGTSHGIMFVSNVSGGGTFFSVNSNGAVAIGANAGVGTIQPILIELEINGEKIGNDPGGDVSCTQWGLSGQSGCSVLLDDIAVFTTGFPASWDALTAADLDQFGISLYPTYAAEADPFVEFGMIEILTHPLDRV